MIVLVNSEMQPFNIRLYRQQEYGNLYIYWFGHPKILCHQKVTQLRLLVCNQLLVLDWILLVQKELIIAHALFFDVLYICLIHNYEVLTCLYHSNQYLMCYVLHMHNIQVLKCVKRSGGMIGKFIVWYFIVWYQFHNECILISRMSKTWHSGQLVNITFKFQNS